MIILFGVALIMMLLKKKKELIMLYIFLLVSIPDNVYVRSIFTLEKWGLNINILILFVIVLSLIAEIINYIRAKKSINLNNVDILMIIFTAISLFYIVKGIFYSSLYLKQDMYYIFKFCISYFCIKFFEFKYEWKEIFRWIVICTIIYCFIYFIIYFLRDSLITRLYNDLYQQWWEGRIYFTNNSCLLFTICFALFSKEDSIKLRLISFIIASTVIILSQTRTLLFVYITIVVFYILKTLFYKIKKPTRTSYIYISSFLFLLSIMIILVPLIFSKLEIKESKLWNRYFSNEVSSLSTRKITNMETIRKVNDKELIPMVGNKLYVYSKSIEPISEYFYVDNLYVTIFTKVGYIGIFIFILINLIIVLKLIIKRYKKNNNGMLLISLLSIIIIGEFMNSQVIYSESLSFLFVIIVSSYNNIDSRREMWIEK